MWNAWIELIRACIFAAANACGGSLGGGVLVVSFVVRLGLLPLTLRIARRARDQQRRVLVAKPALEKLQKRHANDPVRLMRETQAVHRRFGVQVLHAPSLLASLAQAPLLAGLFGAVRAGLGQRVRFAWIADLARADGLLVLLVAALSALATAVAPAPPGQTSVPQLLVAASAVMTVVFLWPAGSAVALSWGAGSVVSIMQNMILAREARRDK